MFYINKYILILIVVLLSFATTSIVTYKEDRLVLQNKTFCFLVYLLNLLNKKRNCLDIYIALDNKTIYITIILRNTRFDARN